jgi:asparagine synthetase B (glutamine-hydrolysing)
METYPSYIQVSSIGNFNMTLPGTTVPPLQPGAESVQMLRQCLTSSLQLRVLNVPQPPEKAEDAETRVAVLFSGGLDCTVLARLASDILPPEQTIDLINVAFENPRIASRMQMEGGSSIQNIYEVCPDRVTGRASFQELISVCPQRSWRFIAV